MWEVAVKRSLGKLDVPDEFADSCSPGAPRLVTITVDHAGAVEHLPWLHRDPFDRILVAQAQIDRRGRLA